MAVAAAVAEAGGNGAGLGGLAGLAGVFVLMILTNRDGAVKQRCQYSMKMGLYQWGGMLEERDCRPAKPILPGL